VPFTSASPTISCAECTSTEPIGPKRYGIDQLAYFEVYDTAYNAIQREKNIKHWPRAWKTKLIAQQSPTWRDLYEEIV
jgi:putative endonuclease